MIRLTRTQVQPIGVDIGFDSVRMLQVETTEHALSVVAAAKQALPAAAVAASEAGDSGAVEVPLDVRMPLAVELIKQMVRQGAFRGREIVTALPREIVHVKNLRLPVIPAAEIDAAVQFEARNIFPFDTDAAHVRHLYAGEVRQGSDTKQEVIVLAARHEDVDLYLEQLHRTGCVVASLDFEPSAAYRGIERFIRRREDEQEVYVLVDIGARRSQVIIGKGRDISFFKPIEIGGRQLNDAVARKLQIGSDEAKSLRRRLIEAGSDGPKTDPVRQAVFDATRSTSEELAREISLCLRYYSVTFRGHRPARVRLIGGEAADPQIQSALAGALPIPVEAARPLYSVDTAQMKQSERRGGTMSEWAVAFGLGLKMTRTYFGARDGKRREAPQPQQPQQQPPQNAGSGAEVVDLSAAVAGEAIHA
jgi:type IV pilus assembly protein PilM